MTDMKGSGVQESVESLPMNDYGELETMVCDSAHLAGQVLVPAPRILRYCPLNPRS